MQRTITALGLGCLLLAGCASGPDSDNTARREDTYTPTGSNIPRRDVRRSDVPAVTSSGQLGTLSSGTSMPGRAN